jgi:hypothetical protein
VQKHLTTMCIILSIGCGSSRDYSRSPSTAPRACNLPRFGAGEYRLTLFAECGLRKGNTAEGRLQLAGRAIETSPLTGQVRQYILGAPPLYGWTDLDFRRVGAPTCDEPLQQSPASGDPIRPGDLVLDAGEPRRSDSSLDIPEDPHQVLIGPISNLRDGFIRTDGCGIGLFGPAWDGKCYRGSWGNWSVGARSGTFRACPVIAPAVSRAPY